MSVEQGSNAPKPPGVRKTILWGNRPNPLDIALSHSLKGKEPEYSEATGCLFTPLRLLGIRVLIPENMSGTLFVYNRENNTITAGGGEPVVLNPEAQKRLETLIFKKFCEDNGAL